MKVGAHGIFIASSDPISVSLSLYPYLFLSNSLFYTVFVCIHVCVYFSFCFSLSSSISVSASISLSLFQLNQSSTLSCYPPVYLTLLPFFPPKLSDSLSHLSVDVKLINSLCKSDTFDCIYSICLYYICCFVIGLQTARDLTRFKSASSSQIQKATLLGKRSKNREN